MSVVLLVAAGLFVRSLDELHALDLGLDADRLVVVHLDLVGDQSNSEVRAEPFAEAMRRLAALPEVESVAGTATPLGIGYVVALRVPGLDSLPRFASGGPYVFSVTPGYFATAGPTITSGRPIDDADRPGARRVAVISETMARALWLDEEPLGRCLVVGSGSEACTTVVGVVEDATRGAYTGDPYMGYYLSMAQVRDAMPQGHSLSAPQGIYVRSRSDASDARAVVASALRSFSPDVRYANVQTLRELLDPQARSWTLGATMFSVFGFLALILAAVGLYSVLAFDVAQRTRELGIRTALGAKRARLLGSVLYQGGCLVALGVALGLAVAYVAAPYARDLLFEVSPRDPGVFGTVAAVLLAVSVAASLTPGLRATRVDPVAALKTE
jgi:predicted permease